MGSTQKCQLAIIRYFTIWKEFHDILLSNFLEVAEQQKHDLI